jgi:hypothetical protein
MVLLKQGLILIVRYNQQKKDKIKMAKKQTELKGIEAPFPAVEDAAEKYIDVRDKRMSLTEKEVDARAVLVHEMQKEKLTSYRFDDQVVTLLPGKEKVRVKTVTDDDNGDEEKETE